MVYEPSGATVLWEQSNQLPSLNGSSMFRISAPLSTSGSDKDHSLHALLVSFPRYRTDYSWKQNAPRPWDHSGPPYFLVNMLRSGWLGSEPSSASPAKGFGDPEAAAC